MSFQFLSTLNDSSIAEAELMDCLLASSTANYPWNPSDPATADYYEQSDSYFSLDDWSDDEIAQRSESFFASIQSCWEAAPSYELEQSPLAALTAQFGARVPQQWLSKIAANVSNLATSSLEPVDQLVQSVQDLLSNWATEDLLVMARPYAYAMRCNPGVDNIDNVVRPLDWNELSEVERAKLTILIAQYAIERIQL
ncbi:hypothetical protein [Chamaesiphon sp. VAR_48_metabat_135_sub]|uniref:hypothetical protein n=1 Tax=Chamaesiphon sp. VAR_48_metabat_135_sub TaxID=2964699 RepID=UPI00286C22E8|nr:hypothetical protein [Chamaesiphon sp. VAR_48_metabat_135_sub]